MQNETPSNLTCDPSPFNKFPAQAFFRNLDRSVAKLLLNDSHAIVFGEAVAAKTTTSTHTGHGRESLELGSSRDIGDLSKAIEIDEFIEDFSSVVTASRGGGARLKIEVGFTVHVEVLVVDGADRVCCQKGN